MTVDGFLCRHYRIERRDGSQNLVATGEVSPRNKSGDVPKICEISFPVNDLAPEIMQDPNLLQLFWVLPIELRIVREIVAQR